MWGLRKGGGGRVSGLPPHVATREGTVKTLDMDGRGYGERRRGSATDVPDRVPQGGVKGMSSGRLSLSTIMRRPYASSDRFPAAVHVLHVMPTVLPVFVLSPTLSNSPTVCVNAYCSYWGSDDASVLSSA